jgi:hypothetical protein
MVRIIVTALLAVVIAGYAYAQASFRVGYLPDLVVSTKVNPDWTIVGATETRIGSPAVPWDELGGESIAHQLTDISVIGARKLGLYTKAAAGYQVRLQGGDIIHRTIQQYTVVTPVQGRRLAHRIASDQTWRPKQDVEVRLRYRIAFDRPLQGESVDRGEFYYKFGNEYLGSLQESEVDLEIRVVPALGYVISDIKKVEVALDYRLSDFTRATGRHTLWTKINAYLKF